MARPPRLVTDGQTHMIPYISAAMMAALSRPRPFYQRQWPFYQGARRAMTVVSRIKANGRSIKRREKQCVKANGRFIKANGRFIKGRNFRARLGSRT